MKTCEMCNKKNDGSYGSGRFCDSSCARKYSTHKKRAEINKKVSNTLTDKYNSGEVFGCLKSQEEYEQDKIEKECPICLSKFSVPKCKKNQIYCSRSCKNKDTEYKYRDKPKTGGYRKGAGRSKSGHYKGIWCDSTYEFAYVVYRLDHNIEFKRNQDGFEYTWNDEIHKYYPDFIEDGKYIEVKGYETEKVIVKASSVPSGVQLLYKKDLKEEFDYVCDKYNLPANKLYELYDGFKPKYEYGCSNCGTKFSTDRKRKSVRFCSRACSGKYRSLKNKS